MPFKYYIDADINCVLIKHSDPFQMDELNTHVQTLFKDSAYPGDMNILRDCTEAALPPEWTWKRMTTITKERMESINRKLGNCKTAWVVKDGKDYAKIHQFTVSERLDKYATERRTFRDMAEARQWLEIPDDYVIDFPD